MKLKSYIQEYIEENGYIKYCCYCFQPAGSKIMCCEENDFIPFKDLDLADQIEIIKEEYENAYGK
jgi:hypothetical protein